MPSPFSPATRARITGLFTGTYGLASSVGPLLGGAVTDAVGRCGVFTINVPFGVLALALILARYPSDRPKGVSRIVDDPGAAVLVFGLTPLLLALSLGGHDLNWTSPAIAVLLLVSGVALVGLVWVEQRAAQPIVPLGLVRSRGVGVAALGMALMAAGLLLMPWTPAGAHLLLQTRTRTLNGDLAATFRQWHPAFSLEDQPAGDNLLAA